MKDLKQTLKIWNLLSKFTLVHDSQICLRWVITARSDSVWSRGQTEDDKLDAGDQGVYHAPSHAILSQGGHLHKMSPQSPKKWGNGDRAQKTIESAVRFD